MITVFVPIYRLAGLGVRGMTCAQRPPDTNYIGTPSKPQSCYFVVVLVSVVLCTVSLVLNSLKDKNKRLKKVIKLMEI